MFDKSYGKMWKYRRNSFEHTSILQYYGMFDISQFKTVYNTTLLYIVFPYLNASNIAEISKTKCRNFIKYINAS